MNEQKESFHYTYSAPQQAEIKRIREKYAPVTQAEDKMERLRRLDKSVTLPGTMAALAVGIISTLIFGVGMCCTLVWAELYFVPGIFIGLAGIGGIACAYPLFAYITKKRRQKLAPEILQLTDELAK